MLIISPLRATVPASPTPAGILHTTERLVQIAGGAMSQHRHQFIRGVVVFEDGGAFGLKHIAKTIHDTDLNGPRVGGGSQLAADIENLIEDVFW